MKVDGLKSTVVTDAGIQFYSDEKIKDVQAVRDEFTNGKEYFFYTGDVDEEGQWEKVLQAFSQFKKWQQSGLQLVCGGHIHPTFSNVFHEKLEAYKYRQKAMKAGCTSA